MTLAQHMARREDRSWADMAEGTTPTTTTMPTTLAPHSNISNNTLAVVDLGMVKLSMGLTTRLAIRDDLYFL